VTTALITGVGGQDGLYLTAYLKQIGYEVVGLLPFGTAAEQRRVRDVVGDVELLSGDVTDTIALARVIARFDPDEIYNLAAISSVPVAWDLPVRTAEVNAVGVVRLLEALRLLDSSARRTRVFQASSAQMFGAIDGEWFREDTPIRPVGPYATAKAFGHFTAAAYRERYGMFVACGILGNHESPLQDEEFLLRHVSIGARRIADGKQDFLPLRSLDGVRDWGYAGDYVRAMHAMLQCDRPADFVIASGHTHTVADVARTAFASVGIEDWRPYVSVVSKDTGQPLAGVKGDITRARTELNWSPTVTFEELVTAMVRDEDPAGLIEPMRWQR
jgi:GDPmannose 4,6-dehydratase